MKPEEPVCPPARHAAGSQEGVTDVATGPEAAAGPVRYLPPTAAEVGRAAALCFQDTDSDEQIARQLGIVRRTLARWKRRADFAAAIAALQAWQEMRGGGVGGRRGVTNRSPGTAIRGGHIPRSPRREGVRESRHGARPTTSRMPLERRRAAHRGSKDRTVDLGGE